MECCERGCPSWAHLYLYLQMKAQHWYIEPLLNIHLSHNKKKSRSRNWHFSQTYGKMPSFRNRVPAVAGITMIMFVLVKTLLYTTTIPALPIDMIPTPNSNAFRIELALCSVSIVYSMGLEAQPRWYPKKIDEMTRQKSMFSWMKQHEERKSIVCDQNPESTWSSKSVSLLFDGRSSQKGAWTRTNIYSMAIVIALYSCYSFRGRTAQTSNIAPLLCKSIHSLMWTLLWSIVL